MTTIAIIPARMGSRRFPGKSMALLDGKPLVVRAVEAARASGLFDTVVVSTESPFVWGVAQEAGAVVRMRGFETMDYAARVPDVIREVLRQDPCDAFGLLLPTSPLRTPEMLREAWDHFTASDADCLLSVVRCSHPPQWALAVEDGRILPSFGRRAVNRPAQDLRPMYRHDGTIIFCRTKAFLDAGDFYDLEAVAYEVDREQSADINEPIDLAWAEFLLARRRG